MVGLSRPRALLQHGIELLYPRRCVGCGRFGVFLCDACEAGISRATGEPGRCPNCSAAWLDELNCGRCAHWDQLERGFAAFEMAGVARHVVHALKYGGVRGIGPLMAGAIAPLAGLATFDAAFAVPLHRSRKRSRGFNQAEVLLQHLQWPNNGGRLQRIRKTRTQVGLHLRERRANVGGAFRYSGPSLEGLSVALVDDVITTGATANECATILRDHGARRVFIFAYARASYDGDQPAAD